VGERLGRAIAMREAPLLAAIIDALGRHPHILVRRRQVGRFLAVSGRVHAAADLLRRHGWRVSVVPVGIEGEPDLDVLVGDRVCAQCGGTVHPRPVGVEVKGDSGREREAQRRYRIEVAGRRRIPHAVVRSVDEALAACEEE